MGESPGGRPNEAGELGSPRETRPTRQRPRSSPGLGCHFEIKIPPSAGVEVSSPRARESCTGRRSPLRGVDAGGPAAAPSRSRRARPTRARLLLGSHLGSRTGCSKGGSSMACTGAVERGKSRSQRQSQDHSHWRHPSCLDKVNARSHAGSTHSVHRSDRFVPFARSSLPFRNLWHSTPRHHVCLTSGGNRHREGWNREGRC